MLKYFRYSNGLKVYFIYLTGSGNCVCIKPQFNGVHYNKLFKQMPSHVDVETTKIYKFFLLCATV